MYSKKVVELLLLKGAPIDSVDKDGKNCLDIAIMHEHHEVIKILLSHSGWHNLIMRSAIYLERKAEKHDLDQKTLPSKAAPLIVTIKENPQLYAMFERRMWDMFMIVLDNCQQASSELQDSPSSSMSDETFDFTVIDPDPCFNMKRVINN